MSGTFVILRFPVGTDGRESEPATVYVDGYTRALYLDKRLEQKLLPTTRCLSTASRQEQTASELPSAWIHRRKSPSLRAF
jgi:hypothetical protein